MSTYSQFFNPVFTGEIRTFTTETVPDGYLECDGSAVSRTTYAVLFAVVGDLYGVGDGSTTFNLPDYRGGFLRGWDNGAANDPDAATRTDAGDGSTTGDHVGTKQADATARPTSAFTTNSDSHSHPVASYSGTGSHGGSQVRAQDLVPPDRGASTGSDAHSHSITGGGDNETRPTNINVMYCIKY